MTDVEGEAPENSEYNLKRCVKFVTKWKLFHVTGAEDDETCRLYLVLIKCKWLHYRFSLFALTAPMTFWKAAPSFIDHIQATKQLHTRSVMGY